jgi:hypothetical protein
VQWDGEAGIAIRSLALKALRNKEAATSAWADLASNQA